jgi:hypothetical protein
MGQGQTCATSSDIQGSKKRRSLYCRSQSFKIKRKCRSRGTADNDSNDGAANSNQTRLNAVTALDSWLTQTQQEVATAILFY